MVSHRKALAIASGLLAGGFLFLRFGWDNNAGLSGWEWYQGATLLGGIGLAGMLPGARLNVAIGLCTAPVLVETVQTYLHVSRDPTCCGLWPIGLVLVFFFGLPAPLIGSGISRLLTQIRLPSTAATGKLGWSHLGGSTMNNYLFVQHYTIRLDCPNDMRGFRVRAFSHDFHVPAAQFSMDETGKLVVEPVR
jgi:hypothetical protein